MLSEHGRFALVILALLLSACGRIKSRSLTGLPAGGLEPQSSPTKMAFSFLGSPEVLSIDQWNIPVYPEAEIETETGTHRLRLTGYGTRTVHVLIFDIPVYVAASYVAQESPLTAKDPLGDVGRTPSKIVQLTMLRDVTADQLLQGMKDAFLKNGIDPNNPRLAPLYDVQDGVKAGATIAFASFTDEDSLDRVLIRSGDWKHALRDEGLGRTLWTLWFGIPVDDGGARLMQDLTGG